MGSGVNSNRPSSLVVAVRGAEVAWLVMVTRAFTTLAPVESVTVPRIVPVSTCAVAPSAQRKNASHTSDRRLVLINLSDFIAALQPLQDASGLIGRLYMYPDDRVRTRKIVDHYSWRNNHCQEVFRVRNRNLVPMP